LPLASATIRPIQCGSVCLLNERKREFFKKKVKEGILRSQEDQNDLQLSLSARNNDTAMSGSSDGSRKNFRGAEL
jgi:hypothetical protein